MTVPLADRVRERLHRELVQRHYRSRATIAAPQPGVVLRPLLGQFELTPPADALPWTAARYADGWFDLLGSGWRPFTAGTSIDWRTDILSGHRWDPTTWHTAIDRTPGPGIDVKLPWELGRLQHLPQLALAYRHAIVGSPGFADPEVYLRAIEAHVVDFITHNPPGRGVQWGCAMDAGIRIANVLLAFDILATGAAELSPSAQRLVTASVHAHAAFIVANLEWTRAARGNHYLADLCGLVWAAGHLEGSAEVDSWLCLAARELQTETRRQFDRDGAAGEGSTSYHRLSAEMVVWSTAVLLALPDERLRALRFRSLDIADVPLPLQRPAPAPADVVPGKNHLRTVSRMPDLTTAVTRGGGVALIGDNDSGRFVKPAPAYRAMPVGDAVATYANLDGYDLLPTGETYWWEDSTDHRHLTAAVNGLFGTGGTDVDGVLVNAYARQPPSRPAAASLSVGIGGARPRPEKQDDAVVRTVLVLPGGDDLLTSLESRAFVTFGLFVWQSARLFLAVRCGPVGQEGLGGHDHRDQLAIELWVDQVPWFRDPGTATYTRNPGVRNAYRSALAHAGPGDHRAEDWSRAHGLFQLGDLAEEAVPVWFASSGFAGERRDAGGLTIRTIELLSDRVIVADVLEAGASEQVVLRTPKDAASFFTPSIPYSPGYGWSSRTPDESG
jgi:hypothetical protein